MIKYNKHIDNILRTRPYRTNINEHYRLDMGERVVNFPNQFFEDFIRDLKQENFITYPCRYYSDLLTKKIAVHNKVEGQNVFISNGSCSVIRTIFDLTCGNNSNIVITHPSFPMYEVYADIMNTTTKKVFYDSKLQISIESIKDLVDDKTRLVVLANPNSPMGDWKGEKEIENLIIFLKNKGILLLLDEAYADYAPHSMVHLIKRHENLIIVRTLSKAFGAAGCRVGYAISSKKIIGLLQKLRDPFPISFLSIKFALKLFDNIHLVKEYAAAVTEQKKLLTSALKSRAYDVVVGYCNWIHFNDSDNNQKAESILDSCGVSYKKQVSVPHDARDNWIRLTISTDTSKQKYIKEIIGELTTEHGQKSI